MTLPLNQALESNNAEMTKRLKYTKDILTHMLNNNNTNTVKPPNTASGTSSSNNNGGLTSGGNMLNAGNTGGIGGYSSKRSELVSGIGSRGGLTTNMQTDDMIDMVGNGGGGSNKNNNNPPLSSVRR